MARIFGSDRKYIWLNHIFNRVVGIIYLVAVTFITVQFIMHKMAALRNNAYIVGFLVVLGCLYIYANSGYEHDDPQSKKSRREIRDLNEIEYELNKLPNSYSVFSNLRTGNRLIDCLVVVGPTGIFTIKSCDEKTSIFNIKNMLSHESAPADKDSLRDIKHESGRIRALLLGIATAIEPVIVLTENVSFKFAFNRVDGVFVVNKKNLLILIKSLADHENLSTPKIETVEKRLAFFIPK